MKLPQGYKEEGYILLIETVHDSAKRIMILYHPGFFLECLVNGVFISSRGYYLLNLIK